ncbi:MAG: TonB-dependent receptor, partial [Bacteroidetes bacterium]
MRYLLSILATICILTANAQEKATIRGTVTERLFGEPVELVTIYVQGSQNVVESDSKGKYRILVESNNEIILNFTRIGYQAVQHTFNGLSPGAVRELNVSLVPAGSDLEVIITDRQIEDAGILREDVEDMKLLPTTTGNLESVLPAIALGTSGGTGGELSSQYNVRGGNYDENLVYVNDFEIYRPQLV